MGILKQNITHYFPCRPTDKAVRHAIKGKKKEYGRFQVVFIATFTMGILYDVFSKTTQLIWKVVF